MSNTNILQKPNIFNLTGCLAHTKEWDCYVKIAAEEINKGSIIAVPTDTIYGIGCSVQNESAVDELYNIKGRSSNKPISICVSSATEVHRWGKLTINDKLLNMLLPGPVTLVFERRDELNSQFNPDNNKIGIRVPNCDFLLEVMKSVDSPLALTSANLSGRESALSIEEFKEIYNDLNAIFDGGILHTTPESRLGSTVVDLSVPGFYRILREGSACDETKHILHSGNISQLQL